ANWTVRGNGTLDLENRFEISGDLPPLPRIGVAMRLNGALNHLRWYGRGPHENYADRKESADMGIWSGTVDEQYVPYVRPQENGNKEDVRWLSLSDSSGQGLLVVTEGAPISASALHYTVEDLAGARHAYELKPRAETV